LATIAATAMEYATISDVYPYGVIIRDKQTVTAIRAIGSASGIRQARYTKTTASTAPLICAR
jgi:hypothetical protein